MISSFLVLTFRSERPGQSPLTNSSAMILNGNVADITDVPHQLALLSKMRFIGGAVAITRRTALTSARLILLGEKLAVRAGSNAHFIGGYVIPVEYAYRHEEYNRTSGANNIAVLILSMALPCDDDIIPIKIGNVEYNRSAEAAGWGVASTNGCISPQLISIVIVVFTPADCVRLTNRNSTERFCVGLSNNGYSLCFKDEGGGITQNGKLIGLFSSTNGCNRAADITCVACHNDFIQKHIVR